MPPVSNPIKLSKRPIPRRVTLFFVKKSITKRSHNDLHAKGRDARQKHSRARGARQAGWQLGSRAAPSVLRLRYGLEQLGIQNSDASKRNASECLDAEQHFATSTTVTRPAACHGTSR